MMQNEIGTIVRVIDLNSGATVVPRSCLTRRAEHNDARAQTA